MTECKADGCDFLESKLKKCALTGTSLRYANFSRSVWDGTSLRHCDLRETALSEMRLSKVTLERVELGGAELFRTSLAGVDLTTCAIDALVLSEGCRELQGAVVDLWQAAGLARRLGVIVKE